MHHRKFAAWLRLLLVGACLAGIAAPAAAQTYPERPIKLIVPYVPGGGADVIGRYIAKGLTQSLGQTVIVENRTGAGGVVGTEYGISQPADGYTLTLISSSHTVNPSLYKLKFDSVKDITPIVQVSTGPMVLVVNPRLGAKSVADLVKLAKDKPDTLNYGSSGTGSVLHLAGALFADRAGIRMTHIPYKGGAAAMTDLVSGQVDLYFAASATAMPQVKGGRVLALGVTSAKRVPALPDVPSIAEAGFPGYDVTLWYGLVGPKGMPAPLVQRINSEVNKLLATPEAAEKMEIDGAYTAGGTSEAFGATIGKEVAMWRQVIDKLGLKLD
ncbi:tripartite tricarboxylate transporter substrate binding protein [Bordetella genomosp. 13]|uniref:tripartite tricarboxylate transporter substrate binding protein n=1 Tax=Bordetella genomosp. 13 TaxID=463040 RepID=UPI001642CEA0|nr:tripartite tricarboxylate transporter substrate binding protein [Bordetella genomosp. 13]